MDHLYHGYVKPPEGNINMFLVIDPLDSQLL